MIYRFGGRCRLADASVARKKGELCDENHYGIIMTVLIDSELTARQFGGK